MRAKSAFLATTSHELRTPLNGVLGVAALLRTTDLSGRQAALLDVLSDAANAQTALVSDLLRFVELEGGDRPPGRVVFAPRDQMQQVHAMLEPRARRKGLAVRIDAPDDAAIEVRGDMPAFRHICFNLVSNALKFTESGTVVLTLRLVRRGDAVQAMFSVTDTGPGIAVEHHERIFERFTQVDSSTTRPAGGVGIGVALARTLAARMGGRLAVASTPGEGATFTLDVSFAAAGERRLAIAPGRARAEGPVRP